MTIDRTLAAIGRLRQRITIETPLRIDGDGGTATITWQQVGEAWAEIRPLSGREVASEDAVSGRVTHEIRLRWRPGIAGDARLRTGARVFDIRALIDEDEAHRWLLCRCEERTP